MLKIILFVFLINFQSIYSFVLPGKIDFHFNKEHYIFAVTSRGLYNQTHIQIRMTCESNVKVKIGWLLKESPCMDEFYTSPNISNTLFGLMYDKPETHVTNDVDFTYFIKEEPKEHTCENEFIEFYTAVQMKPTYIGPKESTKAPVIPTRAKDDSMVKMQTQPMINAVNDRPKRDDHNHEGFDTIATTWSDGVYVFIVKILPIEGKDFEIDATFQFNYKNGFISANDWPFLPFYAVMCAVYIIFSLIWFTCSCCYFNEIIRIQFWIGAVIFLGLVEKAAYLAEYESVNKNGYTVEVGLICAEFISCLKRSLARMLVIIVSLGFGIVKPRLGPTLQKVVAVGVLYFILASIDGTFRIIARKEDTDNKGILASIPLAILDVSICYWILTNLQQTMRTLRVRRNVSKLSLYRHFTNTLIFCVVASVVFMVWSLLRHRFINCLKDWKELWLDDGFWHILFSFILLVIIILWRPSNNSQRFQFTPLMDNDDEEGLMDDENQENDVFDSVKMRSKVGNDSNIKSNKPKERTVEDELKWVEEHIPTTVTETALPGIIDSDEEVMTTRMEISKMD